jgi:hypothetical protein
MCHQVFQSFIRFKKSNFKYCKNIEYWPCFETLFNRNSDIQTILKSDFSNPAEVLKCERRESELTQYLWKNVRVDHAWDNRCSPCGAHVAKRRKLTDLLN